MSDSLLEFLDREISSFTDLPKKIEKEEPQKIEEEVPQDLNSLVEIIDKEVGNLRILMEEESCKVPSDKMIPTISIAEIPWADMSTEKGARVDPNRAQLETYLSKLATHRSLPEKFKAIQEMLDGNLEKVGIDKGDTGSISTILSYVVFVKTLTSIIQNFNPAAAGFLFEGLLGVTAKGKQIPAQGAGGGGTIGDFQTSMPGYKRVSLKLLTEKGDTAGSDIDGSFVDLVGDMQDEASDYRMPYLICLKSLSGDGKDAEGTITVWEFAIDINTFLHWMSKSTDSQRCITLASNEPLQTGVVKGKFGDIEIVKGETSRNVLDGEAVYNIKIPLNAWLENEVEDLSELPDFDGAAVKAWEMAEASGDSIVEIGPEEFKLAVSEPLHLAGFPRTDEETPQKTDWIYPIWQLARKHWNIFNQSSDNKPTQKNPEGSEYYLPSAKEEYADRLKLIKWMTPDQSKKELEGLKSDPDAFWSTIKKYSKGFKLPGVSQWKISQTNIIGGKEPFVKELGKLTIGQSKVMETLSRVIDDANHKMFEIYCELDGLGVNLREFFMKGMDIQTGKAAISNANKIEYRVKSFMGDSESE